MLSAATASSLLFAIFGAKPTGTLVGAILSAILLGFTLYFKEASLAEQGQPHPEVGAKLWGLEKRCSACWLTFKMVGLWTRYGRERDRLNAALEGIYQAGPRTNAKAYAAAQKALKEAEELFFTDEELNKMLPKQLRTSVKQS